MGLLLFSVKTESHFVAQAGIKPVDDAPASASQELGITGRHQYAWLRILKYYLLTKMF